MLIAVDAGNSHVRLGGYEEDEQIFAASIATQSEQTADFYAVSLRQLFELHGVDAKNVTGAIVGSVVPAMTAVLQQALGRLCRCEVLALSSGLKTGLNIRSEQPKQVGADRVAAAVAALAKGKLPCVVVDLGTATAFTVLDKTGALAGSALTAGVRLSLAALHARAAQLPEVALDGIAPTLLAQNTQDALRAGAVLGAAAMVDGMLSRYCDALGQRAHVVVTGGAAALVSPHLRTAHEVDESLCLDGLMRIYRKNRG